MKYFAATCISAIALCFTFLSDASAMRHDHSNELLIELCASDSDSVKMDVNAPVVSFDNRLYQQGIQIGTFDKKTTMKKAQLNMIIQIYDMNGKGVAEAIAQGVNASFAITIFDGNEKLSADFTFDHEAEEFAALLRKKGKL
ncbi:MAG: hypothetical protein K1X54_07795 [Flavobacteriales bacterium]|nr:hypothetical protein [Flavobacteriales bacterium]